MNTLTKLADEEYAARFEQSDPKSIMDNARHIFEGDVVRAIQTARDRKESAEVELTAAVARARAEGMTWQAIGALLGMTRQGAQSFYSRRI